MNGTLKESSYQKSRCKIWTRLTIWTDKESRTIILNTTGNSSVRFNPSARESLSRYQAIQGASRNGELNGQQPYRATSRSMGLSSTDRAGFAFGDGSRTVVTEHQGVFGRDTVMLSTSTPESSDYQEFLSMNRAGTRLRHCSQTDGRFSRECVTHDLKEEFTTRPTGF